MEELKSTGERTYDLMEDMFKSYHISSGTSFIQYIKTKKENYDFIEYIFAEKLMDKVRNKYEVILTSVNWNAISPEQEQIEALNTVLEKLKDDNLNLSKSVKTVPKKHKAKLYQSRSVNINVIGKNKG